MSWSVSAIGKASAVKAKLQKDFEAITYLKGPEAQIKDAAAALVDAALAAYVGTHAVNVTANGSASTYNNESSTQSIRIEVNPTYGFVE